jgi:hypothetical protein
MRVQDETVKKSEEAEQKPVAKQHRTLGLWLFDAFLYPFLTNFVVFGISVAATYLTTHGADRGRNGKLLFGKIGEFFHARGEWLVGKFKNMGMSHNQADMSKMVFFSFADGTLVAPLVKIFEDRRENIARKIDDALGTTPENMSVYAAEPKQSWLSVIGGRLATAAIVVPTAVALDKTGLNDKLFSRPGERMGHWVASKPNLAKHFGQLDLPGLFKTGFFEAFYTSVCTAGLYFSSRMFASKQGKKKERAISVSAPVAVSESPAAPEQKKVNFAAREIARQQAPAAALSSPAF